MTLMRPGPPVTEDADNSAERLEWRSRPPSVLLADFMEEIAAQLMVGFGDDAGSMRVRDIDDELEDEADERPRVEQVGEAGKPIKQVFVDDRRRVRRLIGFAFNLLKLALLLYAVAVAVGFANFLWDFPVGV